MTTTSDSGRLFKVGVDAYKNGEYEKAIASLRPLLRDRAYRLKASMGLVRVYISQGSWDDAQKLCETIGQSSQPSVQQWSQKTLAKIDRRRAKSDASELADNSVPTSGLSGFTPLSTTAANPLLVKGLSSKSKFNTASKQSDINQTTRAKSASSKAAPSESSEAVRSIFHYDYLNSEVPADSSSTPIYPSDAPTDSLVAEISETDASVQTEWAYAGRLKQRRSLGKTRTGKLWVAQIAGAVSFYFFARYLLNGAIALVNGYLNFLSGLPLLGWIRPFNFYDATWYLLGALGFIAIASPWLWDILLRFATDRKSFSLNALRPISAEAATLISQRCRQRRWPLPKLWKLSTDIPLIFSYGWLPRNARLVISEGLLAQLEADEIAALAVYEMAQWKRLYWPILSACGLVLQLFHQVYWQLALWGNRQSKLLNLAAGVLSTMSYSLFWLLRIPIIWIARVRTYYGDRTACEITGNPNGLIRALGKVSFGLAKSVETQGYTPALIESAAVLIPVAPDLARYQLYGRYSLSELYAWDSLNPVRDWMSLPDLHPPLGDRISLISAYAQHWKLDAEISLQPSLNRPNKKSKRRGLSRQNWLRLLSQGTPYFGLAVGLLVGIILWGVGAIGEKLDWPFFAWMYQDAGLFQCCILLSAGIGIVLRINRFFPDLSFNTPFSTDWPYWLSETELLPVESVPTSLAGTIIGRPGLANWLGQDLLLKTADGLLKLHFFSAAGPFGNFLRLGERPAVPIGQSVQLLGWFRRGNVPWVDVDRVRLGNGLIISAAHPIFSLAIAIILVGSGLWLLLASG